MEPKVSNRTPDFRAIEKSADGSTISYLIEATDIDLERGTELEGQWAELSAIDALNEISSPKYHLFLWTTGVLKSSPPKSDLKLPFERLVAEADFETLLLASQRENYNFHEAVSATFTSGGWTAKGALIPVLPEHQGDTADFVCIWSKGAAHIDDIGRTRDRLYVKAKRYRKVEHLIVALRCDHSNPRLEEVLFGTQAVDFYIYDKPDTVSSLMDPHPRQRLDGFWCNSKGPQNQNVIGVVAFWGVHPWSLGDTGAIFFPNPYVDTRMPSWATEITHAEYSNGEIEIVRGLPPNTFLMDCEVD